VSIEANICILGLQPVGSILFRLPSLALPRNLLPIRPGGEPSSPGTLVCIAVISTFLDRSTVKGLGGSPIPLKELVD